MPPPTSERSLLLPAGDRGAARADLALDLRLHLRLQRLHLVELAAAERALDAVHVVVLGLVDRLDRHLARARADGGAALGALGVRLLLLLAKVLGALVVAARLAGGGGRVGEVREGRG